MWYVEWRKHKEAPWVRLRHPILTAQSRRRTERAHQLINEQTGWEKYRLVKDQES